MLTTIYRKSHSHLAVKYPLLTENTPHIQGTNPSKQAPQLTPIRMATLKKKTNTKTKTKQKISDGENVEKSEPLDGNVKWCKML